MDENISSCVPTLRVIDAVKSCIFYCDVLGFKKNWEHRFGLEYPLFVSVSRGPTTIFLTEHPECSSGALVYFYVKELHSLLAEFDITGKQIYSLSGKFDKGFNSITVNNSQLNNSGVYYYQIEAGEFSATKKMILIE